MKKAVIITRAIANTSEAIPEKGDCLRIAVNQVQEKADIRLFVDWFHWKQYANNPAYADEKLVTHSGGTGGMTYEGVEYPAIPAELQDRFLFFDGAKLPCSDNPHELYVYPSSLGAAIDLAYKMGVTHLLLVADNKVEEDGVNFFEGFREQANRTIDIFKTAGMSIYQFSEGEFRLPIMSVVDFYKSQFN